MPTLALDSNAVIYALQPGWLLKRLMRYQLAASIILEIEVLGYPHISTDEADRAAEFLRGVERINVGPDVARVAVAVRKERRRRTRASDACIAATALLRGVPLVTHNRPDFEGIVGLTLVDPLDPDDPNWPDPA